MTSIAEYVRMQQSTGADAEREKLARIGQALLDERRCRQALSESENVDEIVRARTALQAAKRDLDAAIAEASK